MLREAFRAARSERPFHIDAAVVLPDHLHAVINLPDGDTNYPQLWRSIKARFTRDLRKTGVELRTRDKTGYVLWQRRFWEHAIRDQTDLHRHVDCIHFNPVKHGHTAAPRDWPHSSLRRHVRDGVFAPDWGEGEPDVALALVNRPDRRPHCAASCGLRRQ